MSSDLSDASHASGCRLQPQDRRKRRRFLAQWPVEICGIAGDAVQARTVDLSSGGFYCRSTRAFVPGDKLTAVLHIPDVISVGNAVVVLRCDVHVLRVEALIDCGWGIACQILDYSILRNGNGQTNADAKLQAREMD